MTDRVLCGLRKSACALCTFYPAVCPKDAKTWLRKSACALRTFTLLSAQKKANTWLRKSACALRTFYPAVCPPEREHPPPKQPLALILVPPGAALLT
jgi:hypothetical protein